MAEFNLGTQSTKTFYGIMVLGVYLTFRILEFPDLTVDGSLPLGAAVSAVAITRGSQRFRPRYQVNIQARRVIRVPPTQRLKCANY